MDEQQRILLELVDLLDAEQALSLVNSEKIASLRAQLIEGDHGWIDAMIQERSEQNRSWRRDVLGQPHLSLDYETQEGAVFSETIAGDQTVELPPGSPERLAEDYQPAVERLTDYFSRGVITQLQLTVLQCWGSDATREIQGRLVPDSSRKKHGIDINRALATYRNTRAGVNIARKREGLKPLPRLKKARFVKIYEEAQAAIEADRHTPQPPAGQPAALIEVNRQKR